MSRFRNRYLSRRAGYGSATPRSVACVQFGLSHGELSRLLAPLCGASLVMLLVASARGQQSNTDEVAEPIAAVSDEAEQSPAALEEQPAQHSSAPASDESVQETTTGAASADAAGGESVPPEGFFDEDDAEVEFSATAEVDAPAREPTKHTIERAQLTRIAGTRGDALRAVEILPGVGRTAFAANGSAPILRGSAPDESLVFLDGAQVPLLYHFGGLTSFFNSQLIEQVDLYPGNYSARFGRAAGGVVEARVRDPAQDRFHAMLELSAIDSFALIEAPVSKKTSVALAARRSNIDFFFDALVPEDAYQVLAAPVYWDYQAIMTHRFNDKHKLRVLGYGSHDQMKLFLDDSAPEDPALRGSLDGRMGFHRGQIELDSRFSDKLEQRLMVSVGPQYLRQSLGDLSGEFHFFDVNARAEWTVFAHEKLRVDTGIDFTMFAGTGKYSGPAPGPSEGGFVNDSLASEQFVTIDQDVVVPVRPAAYAEISYRPIERVLLVPGVRVDYVGDGQDWTVDPRLSGRAEVTKSTTLKSGVGYYSQAPVYYEMMPDLGNPDAKPFRTLQTSFGVEQQVGRTLKLDVEGFYKRWEDRLVGTPNGEPPRLINDGSGRAYGLEFLADLRVSEKTQAFISYTLSRSERRDGAREQWRLFDYDQTHNLQFTANYDLGHGWLVGGRFRYVTGNPYSAVVGTVYDASTDTYRALHDGVNDARLRAFHQLDVRVEKLWKIGPVGLTTYLEVMNVYNAKNQEGISYSFDFSESTGATGMPIFPNLGIRGEL